MLPVIWGRDQRRRPAADWHDGQISFLDVVFRRSKGLAVLAHGKEPPTGRANARPMTGSAASPDDASHRLENHEATGEAATIRVKRKTLYRVDAAGGGGGCPGSGNTDPAAGGAAAGFGFFGRAGLRGGFGGGAMG